LVDRPAIPGEGASGHCTITGEACGTGLPACPVLAGNVCDITSLYDPDDASFSNTANASGTGAFSNSTVNATPASAQCYLCPQP